MGGPARQHIEVRELEGDDVASLIACIRRCYGESYTEPEFYSAPYLRSELEARRLLSVGAFVGRHLVGHLATRIPTQDETIADTVGGFVDPDYRGLGLTGRMGSRMIAEYPRLGIIGIRHLVTGAHDRTQRLIAAAGGVATGVLLAHLRAGTDYRGIAHRFGDARIAIVVYVQTFGHLDPFDVYPSERYAALVTRLYEQLGLERTTHGPPAATGSALTEWIGSADYDPRREVVTLRFGSLVGTPARSATHLVHRNQPSAPMVEYADVPIADPRSPSLLDLLHDNGFSFGALLPGTARSEAIRMQRLAPGTVAFDAIVTASPDARALLEWIAQDNRHDGVGAPRDPDPGCA